MTRHLRCFAFLALALIALLQVSCASQGFAPAEHSMPAARAALKPEHRLFYDALNDYGDWVLISPYGYVFRPRATLDTWRPYGDGFWVPTDPYGWVWVSSEPYGWATYHYGQWAYDSFQGWVWLPGVDWAPAQVVWQASDTYVGWAPRMPSGASASSVPGGAFSYVPVNELASTNLKSQIVPESRLGAARAEIEPVENYAQVGGVQINRGPRLDWVERKTGPLKLAKVEDLVPPGAVPRAAPTSSSPPAATPANPAASAAKPRAGTNPTAEPIATQRAAEKAARDARNVQSSGTAPSRLQVVRPFGVPGVTTKTPPRAPTQAAPDSAR
jgi:hypothetical protein